MYVYTTAIRSRAQHNIIPIRLHPWRLYNDFLHETRARIILLLSDRNIYTPLPLLQQRCTVQISALCIYTIILCYSFTGQRPQIWTIPQDELLAVRRRSVVRRPAIWKIFCDFFFPLLCNNILWRDTRMMFMRFQTTRAVKNRAILIS